MQACPIIQALPSLESARKFTVFDWIPRKTRPGEYHQQVKHTIARFPTNFRFQLTKEEMEILKSQIVIRLGWNKKTPIRFYGAWNSPTIQTNHRELEWWTTISLLLFMFLGVTVFLRRRLYRNSCWGHIFKMLLYIFS